MTKQAQPGDVVRLLEDNSFNLTAGKLYYITGISEDGRGSEFYDDKGKERCFWHHNRYEIVGTLQDFDLIEKPSLKDIQGNSIKVGDTIAYAFAGAQSRHLALFEIQELNGVTALCRAKADGAVINLGVFEERAIKVKE